MKITTTIFTLSVLLLGLNLTGCNVNASNVSEAVNSVKGWTTVKPSSTTVTRTYNVGMFAECNVWGGYKVTYNVDPNAKGTVTVEMPSNYEQYISVKNSGNELKIGKKDGERKNLEMNKVTVTISAPACRELEISGAVMMKMVGDYTLTSALEAKVSGASNLTFGNLKCNGLDMDVSGASGVKIVDAQVTSTTDLDCSGASNIKISGGKFDTLEAEASGASSIKADNVNATIIDMEASGASSVKMNGQAQQVKKSSSGASSVNFDVR